MSDFNYFYNHENILYAEIATNEYIIVSKIQNSQTINTNKTITKSGIPYYYNQENIKTKCDKCFLANFNKSGDNFQKIFDKKKIRKAQQYFVLQKDAENCYFVTKDINIYIERNLVNYIELKLNIPLIETNGIKHIIINDISNYKLETANSDFNDFGNSVISIVHDDDDNQYYFFKKKDVRKTINIKCDKIIYTISDNVLQEQDNYFLLYECDLDKASLSDFIEQLNGAQLINTPPVIFTENQIKKIYLYVKADTPTIINSRTDLSEHVIVDDIYYSDIYKKFNEICNKKCFYLGDYLIDILIKAKKLYENGNCYYSYYDINAALFCFSNCACLFHSIKIIIKKQEKTIGDEFFFNEEKNTNLKELNELKEFYKEFDKKNTYVLCKLKELQDKFKETNRITKPENNDVDLCVNVKNIVFKKDQCKFFEDIIGLENAIEKIESTFIMPVIYPSLYGKLSKGILLYGPPGTGKTLLVKAAINSLQRDYIQHNLSVLFFTPTPADLKGKYVGESEKKIKELFNCACKKAVECQAMEIDKHPGKKPKTISVIFIDEIDNVGGSRSSDESGMMKQTVNALLQAMDGFNSAENIIVIGATNNPWELDTALLRRFTDKIFLNLPNDKNLEKLLIYEIYDFIIKLSDPYSHLCDKKKQTDDNTLCYSDCGIKQNQDINYLEKILELNKDYNILPKNYNSMLNHLCNIMFVKQYSNSDLNQMFKVCLSKMGTRTIDNELFIKDGLDSQEIKRPYLSAESYKKTFSNNNPSEFDWNNPQNINLRKYFFNDIKSNQLYLSSFNKHNLNKFDKPYIIINNKIYLNMIYCVDRHPLLFLPFDKNIEAAYIEKDSYEAMVEYKKKQNIIKPSVSFISSLFNIDLQLKLRRCKVIIEKNVEIISELEPFLQKYNTKLPRYDKTWKHQFDKYFTIYSILSLSGYGVISFFSTTPFNEYLKKITENIHIINTSIVSELSKAVEFLKNLLTTNNGTIFDILHDYINDEMYVYIQFVISYGVLNAILYKYENRNNESNECNDIYISQNYSSLLLYQIIAINYHRININSQIDTIFYNEKISEEGKYLINFNIGDHEVIITYDPNGSWNYIFNNRKNNTLPTKDQVMSLIAKLKKHGTHDYDKILINPDLFNQTVGRTLIYQKMDELLNDYMITDTQFDELNQSFFKPDFFYTKIFSDLKTETILSKKQTIYFECEIDLIHNINKSFDNVYGNATYEGIRDSLKIVFKGFYYIFKSFIKLIILAIPNIKQNLTPEQIEAKLENQDNKEDFLLQFSEVIKSLDLGNITYLLLSNCKAYYYINQKKNTFDKVIVNPSPEKIVDFTSDNISKFTANLPNFTQIINILSNLGIIIHSFNMVLGLIICLIGIDSIFKILEIPNIRTIQLANLLKRDKIICSYKVFKKIHKHGNLDKIFNQSNPIIPVINMLDDIKLIYLNRILYKIFKNPKLISLSVNYKLVNYNNKLYYSKLEYTQDNKLIQTDKQTTLLTCSPIKKLSSRTLFQYIKGLWPRHKYTPVNKDDPAEQVITNTDQHPNDIQILVLEYIRDNYELTQDGHYLNIQTKEIKQEFTESDLIEIENKIKALPFIFIGKIGEVMTNQKRRYLQSLESQNITEIRLIDQNNDELQINIQNTPINFDTTHYRLNQDIDITHAVNQTNTDFYTHIVKPPIKNYKIHFDIIEMELNNRHSTMNQTDYLDLVEYETNPDIVIEKRLKQKKTQAKPSVVSTLLSKLF